MFDGPISESIPSSTVSFAHRRNRKDSNVSFTYFQDEDDFEEYPEEDAVDAENDLDDFESLSQPTLATERSSFTSKRSSHARDSIEDPLLPRRISTDSHAGGPRTDSRLNQKIYIASEDLTIVFAGFSTRLSGYVLYATLCVLTFGLAYLVFRWFPRWRVELIGRRTPLRKCQWIAIEVSRSSTSWW